MRPIALVAALLLSACAGGSPAPIVYPGQGRDAPVETPRRRQQSASDWAAGEGTPLSAYALRPDAAQPYDPAHMPRTHRVGGDESLYDIAARYQIPLRALIEANGLDPLSSPAPGRELRLPAPRVHVAAAGESFEAIAERYNIDTRSLALFNRLALPHQVRAGERIYLPVFAPTALGAPAPSPAAAVPANGVGASGGRDAGEAPALQAGRFRWPLRGEIVARFGAQPGGGRLDGVEIAGRQGARAVAAAEGTVVYAGGDLPAYGALVLVRHGDNYVSAYGYGRRVLVREGQSVRAGEALLELGQRQGGARLLFQLRRGRDPVDPLPILGAPILGAP